MAPRGIYAACACARCEGRTDSAGIGSVAGWGGRVVCWWRMARQSAVSVASGDRVHGERLPAAAEAWRVAVVPREHACCQCLTLMALSCV